MLEDRDYMRETPRHFQWSATTVLTVVLVVIYALQCINDVYLHTPVEYWLALTPFCFYRAWVWQLMTFQFLHASLWHIAGNLIVFWWVGHFVENVLGKKKFLIALFGCGAMGGLLQGVLMILFPAHFGGVVVGASAGVAGIFAIFALLEKDSQVRLYFILPVRALTLLWVFGLVSLFFTLVPTPREMGIAHAAHLGGILAGIAWVKLGWHRDYMPLPWEGWFARFGSRPSLRIYRSRNEDDVPASRTRFRGAEGGAPEEELSTDEFVRNAVDPILDKISRKGIQSLTARERDILEKARSRMAKR